MIGFKHIIHAIDMHCAGEPTRVILGGLPDLHGATMAEKKAELAHGQDHFRKLLMREPRGHAGMYGVLVTPPTSADSHAGLLFMDNGGYLDMCGHGTICAAVALMETGRVSPTPARPGVRFDTPAGIVKCQAKTGVDDPNTVLLENTPAFVAEGAVTLNISGLGRIEVDVAFGGNFFALVSARRVGLSLCPENAEELSRRGLEIRDKLNATLMVRHPEASGIDQVALTLFYQEEDPPSISLRTVAVFGDGQIDRSPCGTGTSALMALMHARKELPIGTEISVQSIIGTEFAGMLIGACEVGDYPAVQPRIAAAAYMTGINQFALDPADPLPHGFLLG